MLAKLLTSLCLVALVAGIDDETVSVLNTIGINPSRYITVSSRLSSQDVVLHDGPHYYMLGCHGHLDASRLCGLEKIKGIEVRVSDPNNFAIVTVDKKNSKVSIRRNRGGLLYCPGFAMVDLRLSCNHYVFSNSRNRLRLPNLLASDSGADDEIVEENDA